MLNNTSNAGAANIKDGNIEWEEEQETPAVYTSDIEVQDERIEWEDSPDTKQKDKSGSRTSVDKFEPISAQGIDADTKPTADKSRQTGALGLGGLRSKAEDQGAFSAKSRPSEDRPFQPIHQQGPFIKQGEDPGLIERAKDFVTRPFQDSPEERAAKASVEMHTPQKENWTAEDVGREFSIALDRLGQTGAKGLKQLDWTSDIGKDSDKLQEMGEFSKLLDQVSKQLGDRIEHHKDKQTKRWQKEQEKTFTGEEREGWTSPAKILGMTAQSTPSTAVGVGTGIGYTRAVQKLAPQVPKALSGMIGMGIGEGQMYGIHGGMQAHEQIINASLDKLAESEDFQEIYDSLPDNLPEEDRLQQAKEQLASDVGYSTGLKEGLFVAGMQIPFGHYVGGKIGGEVVESFPRALLKTTLLSASAEYPKSGAQPVWQNLVTKEYIDPDQNVWEGAHESGTQGSVAITFMSGGPAVAIHALSPRATPTPPSPEEVDQLEVSDKNIEQALESEELLSKWHEKFSKATDQKISKNQFRGILEKEKDRFKAIREQTEQKKRAYQEIKNKYLEGQPLTEEETQIADGLGVLEHLEEMRRLEQGVNQGEIEGAATDPRKQEIAAKANQGETVNLTGQQLEAEQQESLIEQPTEPAPAPAEPVRAEPEGGVTPQDLQPLDAFVDRAGQETTPPVGEGREDTKAFQKAKRKQTGRAKNLNKALGFSKTGNPLGKPGKVAGNLRELKKSISESGDITGEGKAAIKRGEDHLAELGLTIDEETFVEGKVFAEEDNVSARFVPTNEGEYIPGGQVYTKIIEPGLKDSEGKFKSFPVVEVTTDGRDLSFEQAQEEIKQGKVLYPPDQETARPGDTETPLAKSEMLEGEEGAAPEEASPPEAPVADEQVEWEAAPEEQTEVQPEIETPEVDTAQSDPAELPWQDLKSRAKDLGVSLSDGKRIKKKQELIEEVRQTQSESTIEPAEVEPVEAPDFERVVDETEVDREGLTEEIEVLTFDEFSRQQGVSSTPPSFPETHNRGRRSKQQQKATEQRISKALNEWQKQRNKLYQEYQQKIEQGEIRPPTREESLQLAAQGEGRQAEAAQRVLKKRQQRKSQESIKKDKPEAQAPSQTPKEGLPEGIRRDGLDADAERLSPAIAKEINRQLPEGVQASEDGNINTLLDEQIALALSTRPEMDTSHISTEDPYTEQIQHGQKDLSGASQEIVESDLQKVIDWAAQSPEQAMTPVRAQGEQGEQAFAPASERTLPDEEPPAEMMEEMTDEQVQSLESPGEIGLAEIEAAIPEEVERTFREIEAEISTEDEGGAGRVATTEEIEELLNEQDIYEDAFEAEQALAEEREAEQDARKAQEYMEALEEYSWEMSMVDKVIEQIRRSGKLKTDDVISYYGEDAARDMKKRFGWGKSSITKSDGMSIDVIAQDLAQDPEVATLIMDEAGQPDLGRMYDLIMRLPTKQEAAAKFRQVTDKNPPKQGRKGVGRGVAESEGEYSSFTIRNRADYTVEEAKKGKKKQKQLSLLDLDPKKNSASVYQSQDKNVPLEPVTADLFTQVEQTEVGSFDSAYEKINTPNKAASVLAPISQRAQEQFVALVTDQNKAPIAVIQHTIGTGNQAPIDAKTFMGSVLNLPGAENIWLAHNHPSGVTEQSPQDRVLARRLGELAEQAGLNLEASLTLTFQGQFETDKSPYSKPIPQQAQAKKAVPALERKLKEVSEEKPLNTPDTLREYLQKQKSANGILFMSSSNAPVAWVPLNKQEFQILSTGKKNTGVGRLLRTAEKSNAISMAIKGQNTSTSDIENLVRFANRTNFRLLDAFEGENLTSWSTTKPEALKDTKPYFKRTDGQYPEQVKASQLSKSFKPVLDNKYPGLKDSVAVRQSEQDLPQKLQEIIEEIDMQGQFMGVQYNGKIYFVADAMPSAKAGQFAFLDYLARHEGRHKFLTEVLGGVKQKDQFMAKASLTLKDEVNQWLSQHGLENTLPNRRMAAEEVIADMAQRGRMHQVLDRLVAKIVEWARKVFPDISLTRAEVRKILADADRMMTETGPNRFIEGIQPTATAFAQRAPTFYSQMQQVLINKLPQRGTPSNIKATIQNLAKKGEFKQEELEWSGVETWLDEQEGKVTKDQVLDYLRANEIRVEEIKKKGESTPAPGITQLGGGSVQYAQWQMPPEGKRYQELLLTLPTTHDATSIYNRMNEIRDALENQNLTKKQKLPLQKEYKRLSDQIQTSDVYRSTHWDEPNVLAHIRFNERTDADGNRVLFVEEVQSDWHQKGRKKGYKGQTEWQIKQLSNGKWTIGYGDVSTSISVDTKNEAQDILNSEQFQNIYGERPFGGGLPPNAPFKTTWPLLAMKRMIRYASENGFDKIAWTPGEVQAERYDLSKQVDRISYMKQKDGNVVLNVYKDGTNISQPSGIPDAIPPSDLDKYVGKELAQKIVDGESRGEFTGVDLKVGGAGQRAFYDKMLPSMLNKYVKKWGAKTEQTKLDGVQVHSVPVTEKMQNAALEGQPLFARTRRNLESIRESWSSQGIESSAYESNGIITVNQLIVPKQQRNQGIGKKAMREVMDYADRTGQIIALTPSKDFGATSIKRLKNFYKGLGFVENKGKNKDFTISESMYRLPDLQQFEAVDEAGAEGQTEIEQAYQEWIEKGTNSKFFKKWFGDSKVVDENGKPVVVYHGTQADFNSFDPNLSGSRTDHGWYGAGIYLTAHPSTASAYAEMPGSSNTQHIEDTIKTLAGSKVLPVYVSMENPYIINTSDMTYEQQMNITREHGGPKAFSEALKEKGYDGVIATKSRNFFETNKEGDFYEIIAFEPNQIKSATGNAGTFDPQTEDIRFARRPQNRTNLDELATLDRKHKQRAGEQQEETQYGAQPLASEEYLGEPVNSYGQPIEPSSPAEDSIADARLSDDLKSYVAGLYESASDALRRGGMHDLADRVDNFFDNWDRRLGVVNSKLREPLKAVRKAGSKKVLQQFEGYQRHKERGRLKEASQVRKNGPKALRDLIGAWEELADITGRENQEVQTPYRKGMAVWDSTLVKRNNKLLGKLRHRKDGTQEVVTYMDGQPQVIGTIKGRKLLLQEGWLTDRGGSEMKVQVGGWRTIGKIGKGFFPRTLRKDVQKVLENPSNSPELWEQLVDALMADGHIRQREEAQKYLKEYFSPEIRQDYFAGIEKARQRQLPEIFYDYSWEAAHRYLMKWAQRISQAEQFGQSLGENQGDWFERNLPKIRDERTKQYINQIRDRIYNVQEKGDSFATIMNAMNLFATGTQLGNPATATLNFVGGSSLNVAAYGPKNVMKAYRDLLTSWDQVQATGMELGILGKDYIQILNDIDVNADGYIQGASKSERAYELTMRGLKTFADKTMKYGGYKPTEYIIRATGMLAARHWLMDNLQSKRGSIKDNKLKNWAERNNISYDALVKEQGAGPETAKFLRRAVNIPQGSYRIDMAPVYTDKPLGRFLFKYQKFTTQVTRMFIQNHLEPFLKAKTGKDRAQGAVDIMRFLLAGALGGTAISSLRQAMFNYLDPGPEQDELAKALEDDDKHATMAWILDRAWHSLIASGMLGIPGNYLQFFKDWRDQQRVKNPLDPPGLSAISALVEPLRRLREQGTLTKDDWDEMLENNLSIYRGYKRVGLRSLEELGVEAKGVKLNAAYRERSYVRKIARRYAEEMDMEHARSSPGGRIAKTPMSPTNQAVFEALMVGDGKAARQHVIDALQEAKDPEEQKKVLASIRSSARNRQPIIVAGNTSNKEQLKFIMWAKKNISKKNWQRLKRIDRRYKKTAAEAGLMKNVVMP